MGRDPHALVGDLVLRHLDDELLPLAEQLVDGGERRPDGGLGVDGRGRRHGGHVDLGLGAVLLHPAEAVEVLDLLADVGDVEEGVLLEADVDEGRLHPRQDPRHAPLVDVADDAALLPAFDLHLGDAAVLEDGHPGLAVVGGDEELFLHDGLYTLTNRRWATERTRPVIAQVAMIDEPP